MSQFHLFAKAVRVRFDELAKEKLFVVNSDRDAIWQAYLAAFPPGTDPMFRTRTEHDCSCCRHFIRDIGNVVAIQNGALASVWDLNGLPSPYQEVANGMSAYVKALPIRDVFLTDYSIHGTALSREVKEGKPTLEWGHFAVDVPKALLVKRKDDLDTMRGEKRTTFAVLLRGVMELTPDAVATVVDLIASNAIYRGQEFQQQVLEFQALQQRVRSIDDQTDELLVWTKIDSPVARLRNTAIGTLLQDLSEGVDLEKAVKSFETKVAPTNYRRPTALITKGMVAQAMKTIQELDLEPALERRHARLSDVSVNSVLFVDNGVRGKLKGGIEGLLMEAVKPAPFDKSRVQEIGVDEFMATVLPKTTSLNLFLENSALSNFVSMTAPVHADAKSMFRWGNAFAWSYDGNVADSLREKVAALGGRVDGALRFSHTWNYDRSAPNQSLMDLHVFMPGNEHHHRGGRDNYGDYYGTGRRVGWNHRNDHLSGGVQDVDHVNPPGDFVPVENLAFPDLRKMPEGKYIFKVHNWALRQPTRSGFRAEIEFGGQVFSYDHPKPLGNKEWVSLAEVVLHKGQFTITHLHESSQSSQEKWGLKTLEQVRVNSVVLSPNHWDGNAVGNKHWFFILEGCKNPLPTRGIYNEFLDGRFNEHRRVFEVLGDKTKCPVVDDQMSGVGFSSTRKDKVTVVAVGPSLNKAYTIAF